MVCLGSGAKRSVKDYMLTRYTCYLIAMNGDTTKEGIAYIERTQARNRLKESEKRLSQK